MARQRVIAGGSQIEKPAESNATQASKISVFDMDFDMIPVWLRVGPWSIVAKVYILVIGVVVASTAHHASTKGWMGFQVLVSEMRGHENEMIDYARVIAGTYGFGIYSDMVYQEWKLGKFVFIKSYTIWSWLLLSIRLFLRGCSGFYPPLLFVGEILRYPAIVQHSSVFIIWWLIVGPSIWYFLRSKPEQQKAFVNWNFSFFLINVHIMAFVGAVLDFLVDVRQISQFDVWLCFAMGYGYLVFYTAHCESCGLHFYAVFSPRTKWCFISYTMVLFFYAVVLTICNSVASSQYIVQLRNSIGLTS